jgi:hypothetical protein
LEIQRGYKEKKRERTKDLPQTGITKSFRDKQRGTEIAIIRRALYTS